MTTTTSIGRTARPVPSAEEVGRSSPLGATVAVGGVNFSLFSRTASGAFVVVPGGVGTVLETMMIWQLLQVRKPYDTPLILVGAMWDKLIEWARTSMLWPDSPVARPEDFAIPVCCRTGPEALDVLREHHTRWKANQEARP